MSRSLRSSHLAFLVLALVAGGCEVDPFCLTCTGGDGGDGGGMDGGTDGGGIDLDAMIDGGPSDADAGEDACLDREICNGLDDNCNGVVDEGFDFDINPEHCGRCNNLCAPAHAFGVCIAGTCGLGDCDIGWYDLDMRSETGCEYRCTPTPAADDRVCDLTDDDCDGVVDEDVDFDNDRVNCGRCGRVCGAPHATGGCSAGACILGDCDPGFHDINGTITDGCEYSCLPADPPVEACNRADDDCDGTVDEGNPGGGLVCGTDVGECTSGITRCATGRIVCDGEVRPTTETCNGLDDDCDGDVDEDNPGGGRVCGVSTGACDVGIQQCVGGTLVCFGEILPAAETCNNIDDDCDGVIDNGNPDGGASCGSSVGACTTGIITCDRGALVCTGGVGPRTELCNGIDDDCDGDIDEDNPGGGALCGTDVGLCAPGMFECQSGSLVCVGAVGPVPEVCNGQDDNCDGNIDEGNPDGGAACGSTTGACTAGAMTCRGGTLVCEGGTGPTAELCNSIDDDCNGVVDNGFTLSTDLNNCGMCGRVCSFPNAIPQCTGGTCSIAACQAGFVDLDPGAPGCEYACSFRGGEACNGIDDDCDGLVDEGVMTPTGFCNPNGVCAGTTATCGGTSGWVCNYPVATFQSTETRCDGLDNDCDGLVDEPFPLLTTSCSNGQGSCRRTGTFVCNAARDGVSCNAPAAGAPADEECNGIDDDCDGAIDERVPNDPGTPWRDGVDLSAIPTVPVVVGAATVHVMQYEASRPDATSASAGTNTSLACARANVVPWTSVTWDQAQAACCALNESGSCPAPGGSGWQLCEALDWQAACRGPTDTCEWSYASSCELSQQSTCNGAEHDCNPSVPGDQDCLFNTGSPTFPMCYTDWGASGRVYDLSGNVREWTATSRGSSLFEVRGGSYNHIEIGRACDFDFAVAQRTDSLPNTGFRCCMY